MNYFDKIIIDKNEFPPISTRALEFFREDNPLGMYQFFLYLFSHFVTSEEMFFELRKGLAETEWTSHSLIENDTYTYEMAEKEIIDAYVNFFNRFFNMLGFLKKPPDGIEIMNTDLKELSTTAYYIEVIYCEKDNVIHSQPYNPFTGKEYTAKEKPKIYTPHRTPVLR